MARFMDNFLFVPNGLIHSSLNWVCFSLIASSSMTLLLTMFWHNVLRLMVFWHMVVVVFLLIMMERVSIMVVETLMHSHFVVVNWLDVMSVIKFVI